MVGYVKSQADMPRWGQLGCSGFIVLDGQRRVVSPATAAFMQLRELAFAHVETLLDALLAGAAVPTVCPAQCVVLDKVDDPKKRGMRGVALDATDPSGKCTVFLLSGSGGGSMVRVAAEKLRVLPGDAVEISPRQLQAMQQGRAAVTAMHRQVLAGASAAGDESEQHRKRNAQGESKSAGTASAAGDPQQQGGDGGEADKAVGPVRVASVLNAELDRQHEECAAALEALASARSVSALDVALGAIRRHFEYEERLLDKHLYAALVGVGAEASGAPVVSGFNMDASMRSRSVECVLLLCSCRMCSLTIQNVFSCHTECVLLLPRMCSLTIQNVFSYHTECVLFCVEPLCASPSHSLTA